MSVRSDKVRNNIQSIQSIQFT